MQKSLFTKYYSICVSIILVSITVLGVVLLLFAASYFRNDRYTAMARNLQIASELTVSSIREDLMAGELYIEPLDSEYLQIYYEILGNGLEADFFLVNREGELLICSEGKNCVHQNYLIPTEILDGALGGIYQETGSLGGIYASSMFTVGIPLHYGSGIPGFIFASSSAEMLNSFLLEIFRMFLISAGIVLFLSAVIIYFATRSMVKPLRQMAEAAESFGKGDLSRRVPVTEDDEIGRLALSFNNMAAGLSNLENARRSFVANVSHELKTPMQTIGGFVDGILDGTIPPEKQNQYLRIVSDEVKRLSRLVWSMLNISRIEAGETKITPVDFNIVEPILQTLFNFEHLIDQKHVEVEGLEDAGKVMVRADPDLIHQVVYNLIDNAVKFVDEGGRISFRFEVQGGKTAFTIRNSGEGISKEEIQRVFEKFYKTDRSRGLDKRGVGLGLYIVRTIVNLHGGEIVVRSMDGEYCEFTVSLPSGKLPPAKKPESLPEG